MGESQIPTPAEVQSPRWLGENLAKDEEKNWTDEAKLNERKNVNQLSFLKVIGLIAPAVMIIFSLIFIGFFVSWSLHFLLPDYWQWLSPEQLSKIQSVIFSGSMGAVVASYLKKQVH